MASHLLNSYAGIAGLALIYLLKGVLTTDYVKSTYYNTLQIRLYSATMQGTASAFIGKHLPPRVPSTSRLLAGSGNCGERDGGKEVYMQGLATEGTSYLFLWTWVVSGLRGARPPTAPHTSMHGFYHTDQHGCLKQVNFCTAHGLITLH